MDKQIAFLAAVRPAIAPSILAALAAGCGHRERPATDASPEPPRRVLRIVSVHDGDTCHVLDDDREVRVRLQGIDAPEMGQPFGRVARDRLRALVMGKTVAVERVGQDRYGRPVVRLEIDGDDMGLRMVEAGLAWHYVRYSDDAGLAAAEVEARAARRGLWADREPMPPWEWRASAKARKAAQREPVGR